MIAGLPWTAWLLILAAVVPGLTLAVLFHRAHGGEPDDGAHADSGHGPPARPAASRSHAATLAHTGARSERARPDAR